MSNHTVRISNDKTSSHGRKNKERYPASRTSPWFFIVLVVIVVLTALSGIFHVQVLTRVIHWLAIVL